jgi:hypothetical protein
MQAVSPTLGGAMAEDRMLACEECTEEFVVVASLYAHPDWVLRCPCCGSTSVQAVDETVLEPVAHQAA